jgi:hypothetical protein
MDHHISILERENKKIKLQVVAAAVVIMCAG